MDHALSRPWLQQKGHVLCLLGEEQLELVEQFRYRNILYLNWSIMYVPHFRKIIEVYQSMRKILAKDSNRLLVHCRSGKDRTALAIFGYLRFNGHGEQEALQKLDAHKGIHGWPIMNVSDNSRYRDFREIFDAWLSVNFMDCMAIV